MQLVLIVVGLYMALMLGIGVFFSRKTTDSTSYFLSGRSLPSFVLIFTFAATWIGASSTLGKSGLAYTSGLSAISPTIGAFIAFFIFTFFAGRIRRIGAEYNISSIPELFERRFGRTTSLIAALVIAYTLIGTTGTQLIAFSKVLEHIFNPYGISYEQALVISVIIVVVYTVMSGMYGVAYTDVIQGIVLIVILGCIVPFGAVNMAGGWSGLQATLPENFFVLKPDAAMIGYTVTNFLYFVAGPPYWQRAFSAKSSGAAQRGAFGGNLIIVFYTIAIVVIGICAAAIYPGVAAHDTEMVLLMMVEDLFPPIIYAFTVAGIMSVIMSTTDSYLILSAQTLATDIVGKIRKDNDHKKTVLLSRISVAVVGILSLVFALSMKDIFQAMMLSMSQFAAGVAVPSLAALFSKKVTKEGMISSMICGLASSLIWAKVLQKPFGLSETIFGSVVSLIVIVVVSMATQKKEAAPYFE